MITDETREAGRAQDCREFYRPWVRTSHFIPRDMGNPGSGEGD